MSLYFQDIRETLRKRAEYRRVVEEIRALPQETAEDLGIFKSDAKQIAEEAVYG